MSKWIWGYLYWGFFWLGSAFLVAELSASDVFGFAPWPSLSATWEHAIRTYPQYYIGPLTFACFVFLCVHWIYGHSWWQSILFGLVIASLAHWVDVRL